MCQCYPVFGLSNVFILSIMERRKSIGLHLHSVRSPSSTPQRLVDTHYEHTCEITCSEGAVRAERVQQKGNEKDRGLKKMLEVQSVVMKSKNLIQDATLDLSHCAASIHLIQTFSVNRIRMRIYRGGLKRDNSTGSKYMHTGSE